MNKLRLTVSFVTFAFAAVMAACSSDDAKDDKSGSEESTRSGSDSEKSKTDESTETKTKSCSSSATNGRCDEGPNKGEECCMDGDDCASGTSCDKVCEVCE